MATVLAGVPVKARSGGRIARIILTYAAILVATLALTDVILIALGAFPPSHNYGDPDLGWAEPGSGKIELSRCTELSTGKTVAFFRNETGIRVSTTADQIEADTTAFRIAVTGDSQTDLCAPNAATHAGVLESELLGKGRKVKVLLYGVGRYSPLQDYLAFRRVLRPLGPRALVLNVYTGNDFLDILRMDDRPHFVTADSGYSIAPPDWFLYDDPHVQRRSRVLSALRLLGDRTGVRSTFLRVMHLRQLTAEQGAGILDVVGYLRDLRKAAERSLIYPDAFSAQILNQQLFFRHFPGTRAESVRRMRALMKLVRRENPGLLLVMSPLPSYQLLGHVPLDEAFTRTLERVGITNEDGVRGENELYEQLRVLASDEGWVFVDNLAALRQYQGNDRLFNNADYHLLPLASAIVGRTQAQAMLGNMPPSSSTKAFPMRPAKKVSASVGGTSP